MCSTPRTSTRGSEAPRFPMPSASETPAPRCIFGIVDIRIPGSQRFAGSSTLDLPRARQIFTFSHLPPGPRFIPRIRVEGNMALDSAPFPPLVPPEAWAMLGGDQGREGRGVEGHVSLYADSGYEAGSRGEMAESENLPSSW